MQERTQSRSAAPARTQEISAEQALELVLQATPNDRYQAVDAALQRRIDKVEELLPDVMKGQAARLVKRAMLTFERTPKLQGCTPQSFLRCVLAAAELGLAIDGRLAHAVPFSNKVKGADGREQWVDEAVFIPDYKGIVAVARRTKLIKDAYGDVVCDNDEFDAYRDGPKDVLVHRRNLRKPRGKVFAAYAVVVLPDGDWRYELMDLAELHHVRAKSKSFSRKQGPSGPWVTDENEMYRKTVLKRAMKLYMDDPAIVRLLELDDQADLDEAPVPPAASAPEPPRSGSFTIPRRSNGTPPPEPPPGPDDAGPDPDGRGGDGEGEGSREPEPPPPSRPAAQAPPEPEGPDPAMVEEFRTDLLGRLREGPSAGACEALYAELRRAEWVGAETFGELLVAVLGRWIELAASGAELKPAGAALSAHRDRLGAARYAAVEGAYQARFEALDDRGPARKEFDRRGKGTSAKLKEW